MLTLSRKVGQRIHVGEGENLVVIEVVEAQHGHVRLSFDAPNGIQIDREEVRNREDYDPEFRRHEPKAERGE